MTHFLHSVKTLWIWKPLVSGGITAILVQEYKNLWNEMLQKLEIKVTVQWFQSRVDTKRDHACTSQPHITWKWLLRNFQTMNISNNPPGKIERTIGNLSLGRVLQAPLCHNTVVYEGSDNYFIFSKILGVVYWFLPFNSSFWKKERVRLRHYVRTRICWNIRCHILKTRNLSK